MVFSNGRKRLQDNRTTKIKKSLRLSSDASTQARVKYTDKALGKRL